MRSKRSKKGKGPTVKEILEREYLAENSEIDENLDAQEEIPPVEEAAGISDEKPLGENSDKETENNINEDISEEPSDDQVYDDTVEESSEDDEDIEDIEDIEDNDYIDDIDDTEDDAIDDVKPPKKAPVKTAKNKNGKNKMNNKKNVRIGNVVLIVACIFVVLCFAAYMIMAFGYYRNRFLRGTVLNGSDVSNMTTQKFTDELSGNIKDYTFKVMNNDEETDVIYGKDISLAVSEEGRNAIDNACSSQNKIMWPMGFLGNKYELTVDKVAAFDDAALTSAVQNSKGYNLPRSVQSQPASLKFKEGKYVIAPPTNGDEIDKEAYLARVKEYISELKDTMVIQDADVYVKLEESEIENEQALRTACDKANEIIKGTSLSVKMADTKEDITADVMSSILSMDDKYNVKLDDSTINSYVENLNKKYNNIGMTRTFKTGHGTEVTVKGGDYGCSVNTKALAADIKNAIFNKKPVDTTIKFTKNVLNGTGEDIGKSYIEVDLTNQYLYMFIDGKKVKECPVVTGLPGKRATPQGTYMLKNKMMDVPLVGDNYVTPVKYWMPFNGGIGLHDAVWQSRFGGELYRTKGSHGCVNLMMKDAADIYKNAIVKMPVVCYYHNRISSFQPVASSGPVMGTYRALTDKELKMRAELLNGKKVTDSNAVRDSNVGSSAAPTNTAANNTADNNSSAGNSTDENTGEAVDNSGAQQNDTGASAPNNANTDNAPTDNSGADNSNNTENAAFENSDNTPADNGSAASVENAAPPVNNTASPDNSGTADDNAGGGEIIEEIVVSPE